MYAYDPNAPDVTGSIDAPPAGVELRIEDVAALQAWETERAQPETTTEPDNGPALAQALQRPVSGRYRSTGTPWRLEARIDFDGIRPMRRVSGDLYRVSGVKESYFGSFAVDAPQIALTNSAVTVTGQGRFNYNTAFPRVKIKIPRGSVLGPAPAATVQFLNAAGVQGSRYVCGFVSRFFRSVDIEEDVTPEVTRFVQYDSSALPSGGSARVLSVQAAYAEAGIEVRTGGTANVVPAAAAGGKGTWSNAELHAAMVSHFALWRDDPQWKVWLLHAKLHDRGPGLLGIMFDSMGKQRQGAAVFYQLLAGTAAENLREQLYTCVHELGHCFNLFHSFHKEFMTPPRPNRLDALSWMNYPQEFPSGETAFWSSFPFQFDNEELIHLRHAFRDSIIMGGNPFGAGAALTRAGMPDQPAEPAEGLALELRLPADHAANFALGEPVVIELKLSTRDPEGKLVRSSLHPDMGFTRIAILKPSGEIAQYDPVISHCVADEQMVLDRNRPAAYDSAYIGYGKRGFYFDQTGFYKLRASYLDRGGREVFSNVLSLRVRNPRDAAEEEIADLFFGEEQGMLFRLLGSDSDSLRRGNDAIETVLDKYSGHSLASYARLVKGSNEAREFKCITSENKLQVRAPRAEGIDRLAQAATGIDNITAHETLLKLARTQKSIGDTTGAAQTAEWMVRMFEEKKVPAFVLADIRQEATEFMMASGTGA